MSRFLFDTSICVHLIRRRHAENILAHMAEYSSVHFALSSITVAELYFGVAKSQAPVSDAEALTEFLAPFAMFPFDNEAAFAYGPLRTHLERSGTSSGPLDTLIAAHALALKLTLITNNEKEFRRVPGLKVENWTRP